MLLRYLLVDRNHQFRLIDHEPVEDVWTGRRSVATLGWPVGDELRIVSVLCDKQDLSPRMCFFLRTRLKDGKITDESRFEAYDAMTKHNHRQYDDFADNHQFDGWPGDWQHQLAVALDFPAHQLDKVGIGGPLLMADLWGFSIERILEYFEEAHED